MRECPPSISTTSATGCRQTVFSKNRARKNGSRRKSCGCVTPKVSFANWHGLIAECAETYAITDDVERAEQIKSILDNCVGRLRCKWTTVVCKNPLPGASGQIKVQTCAYDTDVRLSVACLACLYVLFRGFSLHSKACLNQKCSTSWSGTTTSPRSPQTAPVKL
jgi:hypothetical protein